MTTSPDSVIYPTTPYGVLPQDPNAFYGAEGVTRLPTQAPLLNWRKAVANVRTGAGRGKLLFIGDSTTMGAGAGTGGASYLNAAFPRSLPARVASILNDTFVPAQLQSIWGSQAANTYVTYSTYDTRTVFGTGWAMSGGGTLGANFIRFTSGGGVATFAFTPTAICDGVTIYYYQATGQGSFTVNVDGGASLGTTSTAGSTLYTSVSHTFAAGTHTININAQNNGSLFIGGIVPSLSTTPAIDVISGAWYGSVAGTFASGGLFGPLTAMRAIAPDCTLINLTINDSNGGTDLGSYRARLATIIEAAQESGDVLLMAGPPSDSVSALNGTLGQYIAVLYDLAAEYSCGVVDLPRRWGSYDAIQPYFPYTDTMHPGNLAYADAGQAVASTLMFQ